ncbi:MAG: hypothetical protein ACK52X_07495 [bacterium]|jgi:hypothetical protein
MNMVFIKLLFKPNELSAVVGRLTNNYIKFVTPPVPLVAGFENLLIKNPLPLFALVRPD